MGGKPEGTSSVAAVEAPPLLEVGGLGGSMGGILKPPLPLILDLRKGSAVEAEAGQMFSYSRPELAPSAKGSAGKLSCSGVLGTR